MTDLDGSDPATASHPGWSWVIFGAVAFALNVVWELAQTPLYGDGGFGQIRLGIWLRAAVVDAFLITGAVAGASTARQLARRHPQPVFWSVFLGALIVIAAYIEWTALRTGRWSYSGLMPTVGAIGLSPLVQLAVTGAIALLLARPRLPEGLTSGDRGGGAPRAGDG